MMATATDHTVVNKYFYSKFAFYLFSFWLGFDRLSHDHSLRNDAFFCFICFFDLDFGLCYLLSENAYPIRSRSFANRDLSSRISQASARNSKYSVISVYFAKPYILQIYLHILLSNNIV